MNDFNKLKINDAKTEFIVFRSPMLKHDLSDLSVNVGGNVIKPSEKVRDFRCNTGSDAFL